MELTQITAKRIGGYVFVISLLLLGSVMVVWWAVNSKLESRPGDTTSLVSYLGPSLSEITTSRTESLVITSQEIANGAVQGLDIAPGGIKKENLSPAVVEWVEGLTTQGLLPLDLNLPATVQALGDALGLPLSAITSLQILDGAVSLDDLESGIVSSLALAGTVADNAITSLKIADGAVAGVDISNAAVGALQLADSAVTSSKIFDGGVGSADIASGVIGGAHLADGAIDTLQLADGSVSSAKILNGGVSAIDIAGDAITSDKIADGVVGASDIAAGVVTGSHIQDGSIDAADLVLDIITGALIANGTIGASDIADGAITGIKIFDGTIGAADIASGIIDSGLITDGTIAANDIASGAIGTLQLADGSVTSSKIFDGTIAAGDLANGAVGALQLADGSVQAVKLSTASGKKTVSVQIGDVSVVLGDIERPIFVAPTNGTITKVTFTNSLNITAGLNKGVMSVERKTAATATVASVNLDSISLSGFTPQSPSLSGGTAFGIGDVYSFKWDAGLIGVALTGFLVTIEYVPSE